MNCRCFFKFFMVVVVVCGMLGVVFLFSQVVFVEDVGIVDG